MKTLKFVETLGPDFSQTRQTNPNQTHYEAPASVWTTALGEIQKDMLPVAVVVDEGLTTTGGPNIIPAVPPSTTTTTSIHDTPAHYHNEEMLKFGVGCCFLEGIVGGLLTFTAVVATWAIELSAAAYYCVASGLYFLVQMEHVLIIFKAILLLAVNLVLIMDSVTLLCSLLLTECLSFFACLVTSLLSVKNGFRGGGIWHSYIRGVCHMMRCSFREEFHSAWPLQRGIPPKFNFDWN